jgi:hypothetical protein
MMDRTAWFVALIFALTACGNETTEPAPTAPPTAPTAPGAAPVDAPAAPVANAPAATRDVSLAPLPLHIQLPNDTMGAMDMSMDAHQSVTVDIGGGHSLNVSTEARPLAQIKTEIAADTVMFPFQAWETEEGNTAIYRFTSSSGPRFHGFTLLTINGASYLCKTTGLDGHPTRDAVAADLQRCGEIQARQ